MREREAYYTKCAEATSPENLAYPRVLSIIIDLEDSSKTVRFAVPRKGGYYCGTIGTPPDWCQNP